MPFQFVAGSKVFIVALIALVLLVSTVALLVHLQVSYSGRAIWALFAFVILDPIMRVLVLPQISRVERLEITLVAG